MLAAAFVLLLVAAILGAANTGSDEETARVSTGSSSTTTTTTTTAKPKTTTTTTGSTTSSQPGESTTTTVAGSESPTSRRTSRSTSTTTTRPPDEEPPPDDDPTTTTTPTNVCRNSTDPACGPFYWDPPPPPNQPLTLIITVSPSNPTVGDEVTFTVEASDSDAPQIQLCIEYPGEGACPPPLPRTDVVRYGPWDPPSPAAGAVTQSFRKTFLFPGEVTVTVKGWSYLGGGDDPYASSASESKTFTVKVVGSSVTAGRGRDRVR